MVSFVSASVVGVPSKTAWSSTATIKHTFGEVVFVVSWSGSSHAPFDGRRFVKALDTLHWKSTQDLYTALHKWLSSLDGSEEVSLALIAQPAQGNALLVTHGEASIGLCRDGESRWLIAPTRQQAVLEGEVRLGDRLVLQTAGAQELAIDLHTLQQLDVESISGQYYSKVQQLAQTSIAAVLLAEIHGTEGEVEDVNIAPVELVEESGEVITNHSRHLIDPSKLSAGVKESLSPDLPRRSRMLKLPKLQWSNWQRMRLPVLQAGVLVVLVGIVFGGVVVYRAWSVQREYREVIAQLETSTKALAALPDSERAQLRQSAADLLERVRATKVTYNANKRKLEQLANVLQEEYDSVSGQKNVVELPIFYDFRLAKSGFLATRASVSKGKAVFFDTNSHQAISLDLTTKKNEQIDVSGLQDVRDIVLNGSSLFALQADKVQRLDLSSTEPKLVTNIPRAQEPTLLGNFGENLYIFDRGYQQLWRASAAEASASPSAWIRSARGVDFTKISSLSINGSVWLGTTDGTIYKFTRGERENFAPQGLLSPLSSPLFLATTPEGERLIAVEPAKKRVVVLKKDGTYEQQIESEQIGGVTDVFLEEDESAVYLVGGSVVYRIGL